MCLTKQPLKKLAILNHKKGSVVSFSLFDFLQAGSSPVSSISGFSVGSGRVDEAVDDFKVYISSTVLF